MTAPAVESPVSSGDLLESVDLGGFSTDPSRPDYACPAYLEMAARWSVVMDVRAGTSVIRQKRSKYLPKFEAETLKDWNARVLMTFMDERYSTTLAEHVGLVMSEPVQLGKDVPQAIKDLCEDIDGEGNHINVFATTALDAAFHLGHCVLLTDYPEATNIATKADEKAAKARPYVVLFPADDVLMWEEVAVGGVKVIVRLMLREHASEPDGAFGVKEVVRFKELRQQVFYDEFTGRAKGLGAITWRLWKQGAPNATTGAVEFTPAGEGTITKGPPRIAARVIYGGEKKATLQTRPHLYGFALSSIEETQVKSDYASVMHKCNVPTPIFIGRNQQDGEKTVQMGQGIDIPTGGDAKMLEPSGAALTATRERLQDIQLWMRRQGASTAQGETSRVMTATEAAQDAKARNAKLTRAARSEQDALEGVLADMASFMGIAQTGSVRSGGQVTVNQDFANKGVDPAYLTMLVSAYKEGTLTMEELRFALQTGALPEDFDPEDVTELIAAEIARQDQAALDAKLVADKAKTQLPAAA
jgi:Domain of unknown function (DUF4055)